MPGLAVSLFAFLLQTGKDAGYIEATACAGCHRQIYETYRQTGMGRSFYRPAPENTVRGQTAYYHEASDQYFTICHRDGRFYQRRHQLGPDGRETNIVEKEIHFVLGSGNHARTYLHKTPTGQLVELPAAWYAEKGGFWAMNPGYDRPDHMDFRRKLDQECFFCHNAYPETDSASRDLFLRGAIPEGIDCQRCHGPGRTHVQHAQAAQSPEAIRRAIVNPARLNPDRQLEVCLQCHLESTSRRLPYSIRRYGLGYFSYRPGEPLQDYILHFDHPPGTGYDDKFEISHAAYRLLKSACFRNSQGALTCTTCHNPHDVPRGEKAVQHYVAACRSCHSAAHNASQNCIVCHMPRRRTDDVVHVVMTDHYIQRHKPARDLLAPLPETHDTDQTAYKGEVTPFYPPRLPPTPEAELYLAAAQVTDGANLKAGILRLQRAIETHRPVQAEFYFELADAYRKTDRYQNAIHYYEETLRRKPDFPEARRNYADVLTKLSRWDDAAKLLEAADSDDPARLNALGSAYLHLGRLDQAVTILRRALSIDPDLPEVYVNLGTALSQKRDQPGAIDALRSAIRVRPDLAAAHNNLASILNARGDFRQAQHHFRKAIRSDPNYAVAHYNYGRALAQQQMLEEAVSELETALKLDPRLAEAATSLGMVLVQRGQLDAAIEHYRQAIQVKPDLAAARFNLGLALLRQGRNPEAKWHFQSLLQSDPNDYQAHLYLGNLLLAERKYRSAVIHLQKASESPQSDVRVAASEALRNAQEKKPPSSR